MAQRDDHDDHSRRKDSEGCRGRMCNSGERGGAAGDAPAPLFCTQSGYRYRQSTVYCCVTTTVTHLCSRPEVIHREADETEGSLAGRLLRPRGRRGAVD